MKASPVIACGVRRGPAIRAITPVASRASAFRNGRSSEARGAARRPATDPSVIAAAAARRSADQRSALIGLALTRSLAVQPSRSYSAMHDSANCFQRSYCPDASAPNSA